MTTVATDGVTIAADGRTTAGDRIVDDKSRKLHRLPDGSVVGQSGRCSHAVSAIEELTLAMRDGRDPRPMRGSYTLLHLCTDGSVITYDDELVPLPTPAPAAVGSGGAFAMGALYNGASPEEAVRIAKKLDVHSGGRVHTMKAH